MAFSMISEASSSVCHPHSPGPATPVVTSQLHMLQSTVNGHTASNARATANPEPRTWNALDEYLATLKVPQQYQYQVAVLCCAVSFTSHCSRTTNAFGSIQPQILSEIRNARALCRSFNPTARAQ